MDNLDIDLTKYLDENAILYYENEDCCKIVKYKELLKQIIRIGLIVEQENISKTETISIGISCLKSPATVVFACAILESGFGFCNLPDKKIISDDIDDLGVLYFFTDNEYSSFSCKRSFELFGKTYRLYKPHNQQHSMEFLNDKKDIDRICYTVTTSGSTGKRKVVRVPFKCIKPNVVDLQKVFKLSRDVIYASAPCTFDVFSLDMLLSLYSGSTLLIVSDKLRYSEKAIHLLSKSVTFMQITPSLFKNYGTEKIRNKIMHEDSTLRILVLGGEEFPKTKEVLQWQDWNSDKRKRVFNIYGLTEMSCWSMIHEVTKQDLIDERVPLGKTLDETFCGFSTIVNQQFEELVLLSSTRFCYIDEKVLDIQNITKNSQIAFRTGDMVTKSADGRIFFHGRIDDVIKRYGRRISLKKIETSAANIIEETVCIFTKKRIALFCVTEDHQKIDRVKNFLKNTLDPTEMPDNFLKLSFLPLSKNGKVDKLQLKFMFKEFLLEDRQKLVDIEDTFLEMINQIFDMKINKNFLRNRNGSHDDEPDGKRFRSEVDSTFRYLGGTSIDALKISMKIGDQSGASEKLLPMLLSENASIRDIYSYLKNLKIVPNTFYIKDEQEMSSMNILASFNLNKCIDANVSACNENNLLSVGSHSHELITIDMNRLETVSRTMLSDRIESEVNFNGKYGYVGCYDGYLYCIETLSGQIQWKFDTQGKIKSKPLIKDNMIMIGNYGEANNLLCIQLEENNVEKPSLKWSKMIGSKGILANIIIMDDELFVCSLDGTVELITLDGATIWSKKFSLPIFSSPVLIGNTIVFAEVSSAVHCIDLEGNEIWNYKTHGEIFSSFTIEKISDSEVLIYFGCHDRQLRCLLYNTERKSITLQWSVTLQSQIFSTPKLCEKDMIISCSTNGRINMIERKTGKFVKQLQLSGEIFSSPYIFKDKLFVACRNNNLYCIQL